MKTEIKYLPTEINFKANWPYEFSIEFHNGKIQYASLYTCQPGKATWHSMKQEHGEWISWGKPIDFNTLSMNNWSAGCLGLRVFILALNYSDFNSQIKNAFYSCKESYFNQLERELKMTNESIKMLSEYTF